MTESDAEIEREMEKFRLLVDDDLGLTTHNIKEDKISMKELEGLPSDYIDHVINQASDNIATDNDLGEIYANWLQSESYQTDSNFPPLPTKFTGKMDNDEKIEFISDTLTNLESSVDEIGLMCNDSVEKLDNVQERLTKIEKTMGRIINMLERIMPQDDS